MRMIGAPLVYLGPSLPLEAARQMYPGCIVRPPIGRGELYRDRLLRGSVFLIIDGVFYQDQAISPREIIDVIADGALVAGAASMGALRAAECWPAGMRGIGSIYRLFRRGVLESDDEVAVTFDPRASSLALIDVRWAVARARRSGRLDRETSQRVVHAAERLFYADRCWGTILHDAGVADEPELRRTLTEVGLKAADARRAIARLRRWVEREPSLLDRPRASKSGFASSEDQRERPADARVGLDLDGAALMRELARFCVASGRHQRLALGARLRTGDFPAREPELAARLWKALNDTDELEAELFRLRAQRTAAAQARAAGRAPSPLDRHTAEQRTALEHGAQSWPELLERWKDQHELRALVSEHVRELALALATARQPG